MSHPHQSQSSSTSNPHVHHKGYHQSSGKYNKRGRSRGRGYRGRRPALFHEPLLLEGEQSGQVDDEDADPEITYTLGTNADRYEEPEPELGPDGQPIEEPEVDLSAFLERQRLEDAPTLSFDPSVDDDDDDDDVDHSLAHITSNSLRERQSRKGKVRQIEWDASLEEMQHDKNIAQAQSDMKERLRASAARQMGKTAMREHARRQAKPLKAAPPLPPDPHLPVKPPKAEMEDFLDDLLG